MSKTSSIIFYVSYVSVYFQSCTGQITNSPEYLHHYVFDVKHGRDNKTWFQYENMNDEAKYLLCVDVLQKKDRVRLMGQRYNTKEMHMQLPEFDLIIMTVQHTLDPNREPIEVQVMHCPLHTIEFEQYPNYTTNNFYITVSVKEFCVYVLLPVDTSSPPNINSILKIDSEVCAVLLDVRYNRNELEEEFLTKGFTKDLTLANWPELDDMSNTERFILCLDVYEQLSRSCLFWTCHSYNTTCPQNALPIFEADKYFHLATVNCGVLHGTIPYLSCPMDQIKVTHPGLRLAEISVPSYYLTKSVNHGCVYKLGAVEKNLSITEYYKKELFIQAEICGVTDSVKNDAVELEKDLIEILDGKAWGLGTKWGLFEGHLGGRFQYKLKTRKQNQARCNSGVGITIRIRGECEIISRPNNGPLNETQLIPWLILETAPRIVMFHLCENAFKKIYRKPMDPSSRYRSFTHRTKIMYLNFSLAVQMNFAKVMTLRCPIPTMYISQTDVEPFYLFNSYNIGCVYKTAEVEREFKMNANPILHIESLICGIHLGRDLLNMPEKTMYPPLA